MVAVLKPSKKILNNYKNKEMIKEDYVSFETAKLLKEKGFKSDDCHTAYDENGQFFWYGDYSKDRKGAIDAPTLQMAMKWLREKDIIITIVYTRYSLQTIGLQLMFGFNIQNAQGKLLFENIDVAYDSYEQAEIDAIKYSLEI